MIDNQVIVNGLATHYRREGSGKSLLLLHGWADKLETFSKITTDLVLGYDVISLDLPGFGRTQQPQNAWNLDDYATFVRDFLVKINVDNVYGVIGHSNGGALAIRAISMDMLHAQKLVLIASSGVRDTASTRRFMTKLVAKTGKVATFWLPRSTKKKLQKLLYGTIGSDMLVAPQMQETFKLTVRQDIKTDAAAISIPALLIYGEKDRATPPKSVGDVLRNAIKNSSIVVIPGADHFVHQHEDKEVSSLVKDFL